MQQQQTRRTLEEEERHKNKVSIHEIDPANLPHAFVHCPDAHAPFSCEAKVWRTFTSVYVQAYKMYFPIHFIPLLIFKRKELFSANLRTSLGLVLRTLFNTGKSAAFLASYGSIYSAGICISRRLRGADGRTNAWLCGAATSMALLFEPFDRRGEIVLWCFPRALEITWNLLKKRGVLDWMKPLEDLGEVLLFSCALSVMLYCYRHKPEHIKPIYRQIFRLLFDN